MESLLGFGTTARSICIGRVEAGRMYSVLLAQIGRRKTASQLTLILHISSRTEFLGQLGCVFVFNMIVRLGCDLEVVCCNDAPRTARSIIPKMV